MRRIMEEASSLAAAVAPAAAASVVVAAFTAVVVAADIIRCSTVALLILKSGRPAPLRRRPFGSCETSAPHICVSSEPGIFIRVIVYLSSVAAVL